MVNHPSFQQAVTNACGHCNTEAVSNLNGNANGRSASSTSSTVGVDHHCQPNGENTVAISPAQTPIEALQRLFHRRSSFTQLTPQFQQRTIWGPTPKNWTARKGKKNPYTRIAKGKNVKKGRLCFFATHLILWLVVVQKQSCNV